MDYEGPIAVFVRENVGRALLERWPAVWACEGWQSGGYLMETLPSALYILALHGGDPEEAIVRAVNDTRDNHTIAAVVGAAVGALHGACRLPAEWRHSLLGRTRAADDGRVQELILEASVAFGGLGPRATLHTLPPDEPLRPVPAGSKIVLPRHHGTRS